MRRLAIGAALLGVVGAGLALFGLTGARPGKYEEPAYSVLSEHEGFEVREYTGWVEARVTVNAPYRSAVSEGFRVLAGYIFGGNRQRAEISMTSPVTAAQAQTIEMTTPVTATGDGQRWTVSFRMPSEWTLDTLPVPEDDRIELVAVPSSIRAVRAFSGRASQQRVEGEETALRDALSRDGLARDGTLSVAQFDPPWVLGPWRRNEVQLPLPGPPG